MLSKLIVSAFWSLFYVFSTIVLFLLLEMWLAEQKTILLKAEKKDLLIGPDGKNNYRIHFEYELPNGKTGNCYRAVSQKRYDFTRLGSKTPASFKQTFFLKHVFEVKLGKPFEVPYKVERQIIPIDYPIQLH